MHQTAIERPIADPVRMLTAVAAFDAVYVWLDREHFEAFSFVPLLTYAWYAQNSRAAQYCPLEPTWKQVLTSGGSSTL